MVEVDECIENDGYTTVVCVMLEIFWREIMGCR